MRTVLLTRQVRGLRVYRRKRLGTQGDSRFVVYAGRALFRLIFRVGCGTCATARRGEDGLFLPLVDEWSIMVTLVKRKRQADSSAVASKHIAPLESVVLGRFQQLVNHCAITQYDDGEPRKAGWFTVKTMGSSWVLEFKDPDSTSRLVVVAATLDDALALAQILLESEEAPWEPDPWLKSQTTREAKKKK